VKRLHWRFELHPRHNTELTARLAAAQDPGVVRLVVPWRGDLRIIAERFLPNPTVIRGIDYDGNDVAVVEYGGGLHGHSQAVVAAPDNA
jgi:hypothetical protein